MPALANSGIKETKEALQNAIEEIKELEAQLASLQSERNFWMTEVVKQLEQLAECQRERDALRKACKEAIRILAFIEEGREVRNQILVAALAATKGDK